MTPNGGKPLRIKVSADDGRAGVSVVAGGALAPGVSAAQLSTYSTERVTGMAAAPCVLPQSDWWFQAVDTSVGVTSILVLTNPSPAVSVVDLRFLGPDGRVDALGASGIAVAPRSQLVLGLARFAPNRSRSPCRSRRRRAR